jgi:hypothetical protein
LHLSAVCHAASLRKPGRLMGWRARSQVLRVRFFGSRRTRIRLISIARRTILAVPI